MLKLLSIVFLLACGIVIAHASAQEKTIRIALRAHSGVEQADAKWGATAEYLNQAVPGYRFELVPFVHNSALIQAVSQGGFDFVLTNPSAYVELEMRYGAKSLVTLVNKRQGHGYMQFGSVIFTRADRQDINELKDIKNKSFMAVDEAGFGGWRVAWQELLRNGIDPLRDLKELRFAGGLQENVVYAVREAKVDVGAVRTDMLERMAERRLIDLAEFKVLGKKTQRDFPFLLSTQLFPEWSFAKTATTENSLAVLVSRALRSIPPDSKAAVDGKYMGWVQSLDYTPVQELLKELRVGPYHLTSHNLLATIWSDYYYILVAIFVFLVLLGALLVYKIRSIRAFS